MCPIIEAEGPGRFSHSGIILEKNNKFYVLQALGKVEKIELGEFLSLVRPQGDVLIMRPHEFIEHPPLFQEMVSLFEQQYQDREFDPFYLWDDDRLYCSEFVVKFLNNFLSNKITARPMNFSHNLETWNRYYGGNIPQGKPGFAPYDFYTHPEFMAISP